MYHRPKQLALKNTRAPVIQAQAKTTNYKVENARD